MTDAAKCLLVTTHYRPLVGGAQAVYDALARESGGAISVLTASSNPADGTTVQGAAAFDAAAPYPISRIPMLRVPLLPARPSLLTRLHAHLLDWSLRGEVQMALMQAVAASGASCVCIGALDSLGWLVDPVHEKLGLPVILFTHGEEISQGAYSPRAEDRRRDALNSADAVIAVSRFTARLIHEKYGVPEGRIHLLTNGVDYARFSTKTDGNARAEFGLGDDPLVLSLGRLVRRKGFDTLLAAWPQVLKAVPEAQLAIAGDGPLRAELEEKAEALGHVQLLGRVEDDNLPALMQAADVFAMPNRTMPDGDTEGFGLVFLEAAAAGTPSVAGNAGGAPDAVTDGETGLLVDGNDVGDVARAIIRLLTDDSFRADLAAKAQAHAAEEDWPQKAQAFLSLCEKLPHPPQDC
ncbi:glycosyltransferase family 4 protein [Kordiimonas marina]|uniref:glycosyltransferase family 4 protein n=1 Tax=Kordiimonas marina TaxID=2872312 RepID=UPI001FF68B96|nr:glycosyltransferase family 4 protein [Kordiimonas marina]MCJ9429147.1 glycosyltransferase family 4 protein [Kordiimonas marina]